MIQAPANNVLVKISDVFLKRISDIMRVTSAEVKNTKLNPADLVQIVGTVVSVPRVCIDRLGVVGYSAQDVRVGDTAIFRYDVVFDFDEKRGKWRNMFWYKGKEYWVCDILKLFAVIRNEQIIMLNGYCMVENLSSPPTLVLPHHLKNISQVDTATLTHIGRPLKKRARVNAEPGDTVYFNRKYVQKYEIAGKPFGIIRQQDILGADVAQYQNVLR